MGKKISLKAIGLLALIEQTPELKCKPKYLIIDAISRKVKDGRTSISTAIDELKEANLLTTENTRDNTRAQDGKPGCVYFLDCLNGLIKIGSTKNLKQRLKGLRAEFGRGVDYIGAIQVEDMGRSERLYHARFSKYRKEGETFAIDRQQVNTVLAEVAR